ncbi:NADP-dependent oxidoreductase [Streptomyces sp. UNOC14_S4]|uniref:NADP-dependent oxidoreductase n=1 Tax=Streptomyces sp. UNOC14_S4 TaxID=2872340 RepID=UPI001E59A333|nr:NADP-dependent oxidoreductase [Streptomyces sp. UNOC14_S4]MCC3768412.1 NADP-dependent oxidoreductase [Streptomyces sp. UNOC14_S4]
MKAVSYRAYGGPEVLEYGERPIPKIGPDSVLVQVKAAAVNPVDWKVRAGYLDPMMDAVFPVVPGWDVAGVVVGLGADTPEYRVGDEVIGYVREDFLSRGTFAEYVAAPVRTLARKPAGLTFEQAAGIPLAGLTAYQALKATGTGEGDTVLVHAAAGGVGTMAVQLARHLGARVIGTASEGNHEFLRSLGAEPVAYGDGLAERVRALAPEGVDVVLDLVGGGAVRTVPDVAAAAGARVVSIADPEVAGLGGRLLWVRPDSADLAELSRLAEMGVLRVEVAEVFPLARTADAHRLSEGGHVRGKVVVTVP